MRKLIFAINVTADGCCDHTAFHPDAEVHEYFARMTREAGVLLYGRKTYELMVPYWPDVARNKSGATEGDNAFAQAFVSVPRIVVFSKTLKTASEKNVTIFSSDVQGEIQKLKQEDGKSILVGGVSFPTELLKLNLIDEFRVVVHPAVTGSGRRLFDSVDLQEKPQLKLIESHTFKSGSVALHYRNDASSQPSARP